MKDYRGNPVGTQSHAILTAVDHFQQQIVASGSSADNILTAVQSHPESMVLQLYSAIFYLFGQDNGAKAIAFQHLRQAEQVLSSAGIRECLLLQAVSAWSQNDYKAGLERLHAITQQFPRDIFSAKLAEWLYYCSGQYYHAQRYLALCERIAKENQDQAYFLAMHAFAHELNGHLQEAQILAEKAITLEKGVAWAHHCLAHVYLNSNQIATGIQCLQAFQPEWQTIFPLLRGHNIWHLALFHLANRDEQEIMNLYPSIFGTLPDLVGEHIDSISLLWRMDLAGLPQDKPFKVISTYIKEKPFEYHTGFNTVHYMYCLGRVGEVATLQQALSELEMYAKSNTDPLWIQVIFPLVKAIHAFLQQDYGAASELIQPILQESFAIGGSDAQDELITQTYLMALIRSGKINDAQKVFDTYLAHYKNTELARYWFEGEYP